MKKKICWFLELGLENFLNIISINVLFCWILEIYSDFFFFFYQYIAEANQHLCVE